jgi:hypothetical protein
MGTIKKVRPKTHDALTQAISLVLDFAGSLGISQQMRNELAQAQGRFSPSEGWGFIMLNPEQQRFVLKEINEGPRPNETLRVWNACISFIAYDCNAEIFASRTEIANVANVLPPHTSTALSRLDAIGALLRIERGRYRINPNVGWSGPLLKRQDAAKDAPRLACVNGQVIQQLPERTVERAIEYLRNADIYERLRWARRAVELGATETPTMTATAREYLNEKWVKFVAVEMVSAGVINV